MRTRYLVVPLVAVLSAGTGYLARSYLTQGDGESALAESLLEEASGILEESRVDNIIRLAAEDFAAAGVAIDAARELLETEGGAAALEPARSALTRAREAREAALARVTVRRAAVLRRLVKKVLHRSAGGLAWSDARPQMSLFDGDRVATRQRSEAFLHFSDGNELRVEQNSVVAIRRFVEDRAHSLLNAELAVDKGTVRSVVTRDGGNDVRMEFNLPGADVVVDTMTSPEGQAEVGLRTHGDQTNSVAVYQGRAEVIGSSGERLVLEQDTFTEVSKEGRLTAPRPLPGLVEPVAPLDGVQVAVTARQGEVALRWMKLAECRSYRAQLARDARFEEKLVDEQFRQARAVARGLDAGTYAWRVCCVGEGEEEGPFSEPRLFEVVVDDEAPRLAVVEPRANAVVSAETLVAQCRTESSAVVFINGVEATALGEGAFERSVELRPGVNALVFEAMDAAGNSAYTSVVVTQRN